MESPYPDLSELQSYVGKHKSELPSPSLCLSLPIVQENARVFHENVEKSGLEFRAHVKSNKTVEISRILLGERCNRVIVSTLREARGLKQLIMEGVVKDVLYGVPVGPSKLAELDQLAKDVTIRLLIDNSEHVSILSQYKRCPENHGKPWSVFIKLDMGTFRAGLPLHSPALGELVHAAEDSSGVEIYGFYSYSAKASAGRSVEDAETVLQEHIKGVLQASKLVRDQTLPLTLSIGSSPTARVIGPIREQIGANIKFEIHAGTVIYNDLQQLATATVARSRLAMSVITEICSVYPERNEALINSGVLALTREPGCFTGISRVRSHENDRKNGWVVGRVSQEHGVMTYAGETQLDMPRVEDVFKIGEKIELDVQHTCIAGAMFGWHFITDADGIVRDIYYPWKWW